MPTPRSAQPRSDCLRLQRPPAGTLTIPVLGREDWMLTETHIAWGLSSGIFVLV